MNPRILRAKIIEVYGGQWRFAQAIEEHESVVSKVIRGRRKLTPEKKKVWAKALGLKQSDISEGLRNGQ